MIAVCLTPWTMRNMRVLGAPIYTRSNLGLEIDISNNDLAGPLEPENYRNGVYHAIHPLQNLQAAQAVRQMGEVAYNKDRLNRALTWIKSHPRRFLTLTAERALYTWFPNTRVGWRDRIVAPFTIGCLLGLILLWKQQWPYALLLVLCLAAYTPLYYLIHVTVRHRYPIDWILLLGSCHFAVAAMSLLTFAARRPAAAHAERV
jgi:hypothetical protein